MNNLAPIILFVYNRPIHTRQTLEGLFANELADGSLLYIYADGPKDNATEEQKKSIREVRDLIKEKKWCKEVYIVEKEKNLGLAESVIRGVTEIILQHEKIIVMEDDLLTSRFFLKFMNDALFYYNSTENVYGCTGYFEPIPYPQADFFFNQKGASWGWGTWKRAWENFIPDPSYFLTQFKSKRQINTFNMGGYPFFEMLNSQKNKKIDSWAISFYAYTFLNNGLWLAPTKSLVKNIGFDSSGVHCGNNQIYDVTIYDKEIPIHTTSKVVEHKILKRKKEKFYQNLIGSTLFTRIVNKIKSYA